MSHIYRDDYAFDLYVEAMTDGAQYMTEQEPGEEQEPMMLAVEIEEYLALKEENKRLREVLERIPSIPSLELIHNVAREALEKQ